MMAGLHGDFSVASERREFYRRTLSLVFAVTPGTYCSTLLDPLVC